jgi:hypothetical protein
MLWLLFVGQDSSVIITTRYRLDCLGIKSRWGEVFQTGPLGPFWPPVWCVLGLCWVKHLGHGIDHPSPFITEVKERTEVYLCFLSIPS